LAGRSQPTTDSLRSFVPESGLDSTGCGRGGFGIGELFYGHRLLTDLGELLKGAVRGAPRGRRGGAGGRSKERDSTKAWPRGKWLWMMSKWLRGMVEWSRCAETGGSRARARRGPCGERPTHCGRRRRQGRARGRGRGAWWYSTVRRSSSAADDEGASVESGLHGVHTGCSLAGPVDFCALRPWAERLMTWLCFPLGLLARAAGAIV